MSTVELKEQLIEKIKNTNNEVILVEAFRLLNIETLDLDIYRFSKEELNEVNASRIQITNGQYLTNDTENEEIEQWL